MTRAGRHRPSVERANRARPRWRARRRCRGRSRERWEASSRALRSRARAAPALRRRQRDEDEREQRGQIGRHQHELRRRLEKLQPVSEHAERRRTAKAASAVGQGRAAPNRAAASPMKPRPLVMSGRKKCSRSMASCGAGESGEQAADQDREQLDPRGVNAGRDRRRLVLADRAQRVAERRAIEEDRRERNGRERDEDDDALPFEGAARSSAARRASPRARARCRETRPASARRGPDRPAPAGRASRRPREC